MRTSSPSAATRCTRPTAPARSSALVPRSPTATRSSPAAVPSSSSTRRGRLVAATGARGGRLPNVLGAVALGAAARELAGIGWQQIREHDAALARTLHAGLSAIPGVRLLGPGRKADTLPIASFVLDGVAAPAGGRPAERRVRHRRAARMLLRAPLPRPGPRSRPRGAAALPIRRPPARPQLASRRGARVGRNLDDAERPRAPARGGPAHREHATARRVRARPPVR